jgi:hypothetical protein
MTAFFKRLCKLLSRPSVWFCVLLFLLLALVAVFLITRWLRPAVALFLLLLMLVGLIPFARFLARLMARLCRKMSADPKGQGSLGQRGARRMRIPAHTYKRPDPLIYSQSWLMSQGAAVAWDNPDIQLLHNGAPVSSHELLPATSYRIRALIWNGSTEAPAVNVLVRFYYLTFGIDTVRHYIGETLVDVPVKGAPGLPATAEGVWTTPAVAGHYCLQVELVWPDDANPHNNLGQENVDVKKLNSPTATYQFAVRNGERHTRTFTLEADSYAVPALPECPPEEANAALASALARGRHERSRFPIRDGYSVEILPSPRLQLEPGEERMVTVKLTAPDGFTGRGAINVNAFSAHRLVGGVTLYFVA